MKNKLFGIYLSIMLAANLSAQTNHFSFRIRTITAGISLKDLADTTSLLTAIEFLQKAKKHFEDKGYEVQTIRVSTQNFHTYQGQRSFDESLKFLLALDQIAQRNNIIVSIGQLLQPDKYEPGIGAWAEKLVRQTKSISFSLSISSHDLGVHTHSIKAAAEIISVISKVDAGEANFRFTASANCPPGIPYFPAAYHEGKNSFAVGLESANLVKEGLINATALTARSSLKSVLEKNLGPVQRIGEEISDELHWPFDGLDVSPAPGLDASIAGAIESYTKKPFGDPATLAACALITDVLKNLDIKKCGYSGLMLPVIEDKVLAQRATENRFTVQELLLYSSVSGTGLDVVPLPGDTPTAVLENILSDVAALSLKYTAKALSARLFLIPGKKAGDKVEFKNPHLTASTVMRAD